VVVAARLTADFGRAFTDRNLRDMIRFVGAFPDREIVDALSRQLSWTQFCEKDLETTILREIAICILEQLCSRLLHKFPRSVNVLSLAPLLFLDDPPADLSVACRHGIACALIP
jgi:hypothetical protein